ncbi:hypothetical protein HETIRDRAFT_146537 [Heterobasidion irregulare TC 32-1]|uniref:Uncharacterized protein n=1 Tax=Heterobasidion irregulare (strain TC 32-1) TaxID=747525 RepID=W4KE22_HETIT|nr:uncharacterized protein HETIRDRAFT_146537 [Heterobasidion irregulare TC 32-1]ETW83565.1 hypothetical protein HETIRDRAFT_146537 [Heterobasidion irregulare TC 32-1]
MACRRARAHSAARTRFLAIGCAPTRALYRALRARLLRRFCTACPGGGALVLHPASQWRAEVNRDTACSCCSSRRALSAVRPDLTIRTWGAVHRCITSIVPSRSAAFAADVHCPRG